MKIVFFGTPHFAAEILRFLVEKAVPICAVVTQPDRPQGRSLLLTASPVKRVAQTHLASIPLFQPEKASHPQFLEELSALQADLYLVIAYGQILSQKLLDIPPLGCINVHASLLPLYRGAAPIQRVLMAGEKKTGVAIQKMVKQLDAGDVIASSETSIPEEMNCAELEKALCESTKPLLLDVLSLFEKGIPPGLAQNHEKATYASKISPEEGEIKWDEPSEKIHNLVRAFSPKPGAWCWVLGKKIKILRTTFSREGGGKPGELLSRKEGIIACGEGTLRLLQIQSEGKRVMSWSEWICGMPQHISF